MHQPAGNTDDAILVPGTGDHLTIAWRCGTIDRRGAAANPLEKNPPGFFDIALVPRGSSAPSTLPQTPAGRQHTRRARERSETTRADANRYGTRNQLSIADILQSGDDGAAWRSRGDAEEGSAAQAEKAGTGEPSSADLQTSWGRLQRRLICGAVNLSPGMAAYSPSMRLSASIMAWSSMRTCCTALATIRCRRPERFVNFRRLGARRAGSLEQIRQEQLSGVSTSLELGHALSGPLRDKRYVQPIGLAATKSKSVVRHDRNCCAIESALLLHTHNELTDEAIDILDLSLVPGIAMSSTGRMADQIRWR